MPNLLLVTARLASVAPSVSPGDTPPLSLTLMMGFTCCALALVVGVLVLGFILATTKNKDEKRKKDSETPTG
jgi:hypothetical protein